MRQILVIGDDHTQDPALCLALRDKGFAVNRITALPDRLSANELYGSQAVLIEASCHFRDTHLYYQQIRAVSDLPIVICFSQKEKQKLRSLQMHPDTYSFCIQQSYDLLAEKLLRILSHQELPQDMDISLGGLQLFFQEHRVVCDGQTIHLTPKEFSLLFHLMHNHDAVLTREQLFYLIWGDDKQNYSHSLLVYVNSLRKKLGPYGKNIISMRKVGYLYRFKTDEKMISFRIAC